MSNVEYPFIGMCQGACIECSTKPPSMKRLYSPDADSTEKRFSREDKKAMREAEVLLNNRHPNVYLYLPFGEEIDIQPEKSEDGVVLNDLD